MSEYISIDAEPGDLPNSIVIRTNLNLAPDGVEVYPNIEQGEEGSPLAQTLFGIEGILALTLDGDTMFIQHVEDMELFMLMDEVDTALKDFFL